MRYVAQTSCFIAAAGLLLSTAGFQRTLAADDTTGSIVSAVEQVCLPLIDKQPIQAVASASGMTRRDGDWTLRLQGAGSVRISPPSPANPAVCMGSVTYERANERSLVSALADWASARGLKPVKTAETSRNADLAYRTSSWSGRMAGKTVTVVFTEQTELDGRPTGGSLDEATLLVSGQS